MSGLQWLMLAVVVVGFLGALPVIRSDGTSTERVRARFGGASNPNLDD